MIRIFIAGATGVIGRELIPNLLSRPGTGIRAIVRDVARAEALFGRRVEAVEGNLLDRSISDVLDRVLKNIDVAIHIATRVPRDRTAPGAWEENFRLRKEFTDHLVQAALRQRVPYLICQSIEMAYPDWGDNLIPEETELDTSPDRSSMTAPVRRMEELIMSADPSSLAWTILRGGLFVGKGTDEEDLVRRMEEGTELMPENPEVFQSHVTPGDYAEAIALCITKRPVNQVYNVNAEPLRYADYLQRLATSRHVPLPSAVKPGWKLLSYRCDARKIQRELGWRPRGD